MKIYILAFLIGCAVAAPAVNDVQGRSISTLLKDIIKETGIKDQLPWLQEKIKTDPDAQRIVEYLRSDAAKKIVEHLHTCDEYQLIKDELLAEGIDIPAFLELIREFIANAESGVIPSHERSSGRNLGSLLNEFLGRLDLTKIMEIVQHRFHNDPDMKRLVAFLKRPEFKDIVDCMKSSSGVQELNEKLLEEGVDIVSFVEMIRIIFGAETYYSAVPRKISDMLHELVEKLDLKKPLAWLQDKFKNDADLQKIVQFLRSEKFTNIVNHLKNCEGYQNIRDKLEKEGFDIPAILEKIKDFITSAESRAVQPASYTLDDPYNEFLGMLDIGKIIEVLKNEFQNNPDMKKLIQFLKSDDFHAIHLCMQKSPEVQELKEKLIDEGVDIEALIEMIKTVIGAESFYYQNSRNIADMLHEVAQEIGLEDHLPWLQDKIKNDPDAQKIVDYLKSDAFNRIVDHLKNCKGYQNIKDKLLGEGIDIPAVLEKIKDFITASQSRATAPASYSLGDLLNEFLSLFDISHTINVIKDKFENDKDMQTLVSFIRSDDAKAIVECMRTSSDVQELIVKLRDEGIDIVDLVEMIKTMLGA